MKSNVKSKLERALQFSIDNSPKGFIVPPSALEKDPELVKKVTTASYIMIKDEATYYRQFAERLTVLEVIDRFANNFFYLTPIPNGIPSSVKRGMHNWDKALQIFSNPGFFNCIAGEVWDKHYAKYLEAYFDYLEGDLPILNEFENFILDKTEGNHREEFNSFIDYLNSREPQAGTWG